MAFKFAVGDTVAFQNMRSKETVFTIIQRMPSEDHQSERRYKIKAVGEDYERIVTEDELNTQFEDRQPRAPARKKGERKTASIRNER